MTNIPCSPWAAVFGWWPHPVRDRLSAADTISAPTTPALLCSRISRMSRAAPTGTTTRNNPRRRMAGRRVRIGHRAFQCVAFAILILRRTVGQGDQRGALQQRTPPCAPQANVAEFRPRMLARDESRESRGAVGEHLLRWQERQHREPDRSRLLPRGFSRLRRGAADARKRRAWGVWSTSRRLPQGVGRAGVISGAKR